MLDHYRAQVRAWPKVHDGVMRVSRAQAEALVEGLDWRRTEHGLTGFWSRIGE
jgi:transposase